MTLRDGDVILLSMLPPGTETASELAEVKAAIIADFNRVQDHHHVLVGPIEYDELKPIDDLCPDPPDWCHGPDVRVLVGEAKVVCRAPDVPLAGGFSTMVDAKTLAALRKATQRVHRMERPTGRPMTDGQCDAMIDSIAPETAERMLREATDGGVN